MSTHGYDTSVGYGYGFCREMAPDWLDLCARLSGFAPRPRNDETPFRYLELGCGQGAGLCLLAAANPQAEFVGVDFLPEHVAHAEALAVAGGLANVRFSAADFVELAAAWPKDFGTFDYVALHGVYSWVSDPVRAALVGCLAHATGPGMLVYNGYNTLPGWLGSMPFQHIAQGLKASTGAASPAVLGQAIALFDGLRAAGTRIFDYLPALKARIDSLKTKRIDYLVHEYLHEGWKPQWHSELARELGRAGLEFVGSATIAENLLPGVLPPAMRDPIEAIADPRLRQDLQDFVINQAFRRDVFCRGERGIRQRDLAAIGRTTIHLLAPPDDNAELAVEAPFGEVRLQPPAFSEIVDALAAGPQTIDELAGLPGSHKRGFEAMLQVVVTLLHSRHLAVGAGEDRAAAAPGRLNAAIARAACDGATYDHLAAAALGSAIQVSEMNLLFLDAWHAANRADDAEALAAGVAERMAGLGRALQRDGKPLTPDEMRPHLVASAGAFVGATLPHWRKLGAIA